LGSQTVGEQMCRISPVSIRRVLQQARGQYDAVLIDTGPILGSIEASVAASEADGVVLVMARGQARSLFDLALAELESVRAHPLGVLFNRARDNDMQTYGLSSRSSISTRVSIARNGHTHVGPIASAVSDSTQLRARLGIDRAR
jgi:cellulose biosynthesis protein BcsQ